QGSPRPRRIEAPSSRRCIRRRSAPVRRTSPPRRLYIRGRTEGGGRRVLPALAPRLGRFSNTVPTDDRASSQELLATLTPEGPEWVPVHPGLFADECRWFLAAVDAKLITFQECGESCSRLRRSGPPDPTSLRHPLASSATSTRLQDRRTFGSIESTYL